MDIASFKDCEGVPIDKFPFKGTQRDVIGTSIRWLSKFGDDGTGNPEYGLRHFTIQPGGEIPVHNHFYHQTMYILNGEFRRISALSRLRFCAVLPTFIRTNSIPAAFTE